MKNSNSVMTHLIPRPDSYEPSDTDTLNMKMYFVFGDM